MRNSVIAGTFYNYSRITRSRLGARCGYARQGFLQRAVTIGEDPRVRENHRENPRQRGIAAGSSSIGMKSGKRGRGLTRELTVSQSILIRMFWLCVISCLFLIFKVEVHAAQQNDPTVENETETKDETVQNQPWKPPPPPPDEFDWIQLKSGEWLKGELIKKGGVKPTLLTKLA